MKRISNEEKYELMNEFIKETGKQITTGTIYKGYNIGSYRNNLRQMYYNGTLSLKGELLKKFIEIGVISEEKEKIRTTPQEKYEFLMSLSNKKVKSREKYKMRNGLSYSKVRNSIQVDYNRGKLNLTNEQIENLKNEKILNYSREEIKMIEKDYQMPHKYAIDIKEKYSSLEHFLELYKKCQCEYDFNNDIFCGFRGIIISKNSFNEYQKLQYAIFIKDIVMADDFSFIEYNTGLYFNIDIFKEALETLTPRESKFISLFYALDGKKYSINEISDLNGLSPNRVRQIIDKAKRKLRHPSRSKYMIRNYQNICKKIDELNEKINELNIKIEDVKIILFYLESNHKDNNPELDLFISDKEKIEKLKSEGIYNLDDLIKKYYIKKEEESLKIDIRDLNLSVRAYNCIHRARIEYVSDLTNLTENQLRRIRSLGNSVYDEIINKLSSMGLRLRYEEKDIKTESFNKNNEMHEIMERYLNEKLVELKECNIQQNNLVNEIRMYYNAVMFYLDLEDIFNSSYIIPNISIENDNQLNYENIKKSLASLNIINENNKKKTKNRLKKRK